MNTLVVSPEVYTYMLRDYGGELLYEDEIYYIYKKGKNIGFWKKVEIDGGSYVSIDREDIPDNVLEEVSKELI